MLVLLHNENTPIKYIENVTTKKWKFSDKKKSDISRISAQK